MERVRLTGQELRGIYQDNVVLSQVFSDIESDLKEGNKVVCRYVVNGLEISEEDEIRLGRVTLNEIDLLEYDAECSSDVVRSVLNGWIDSLPQLILRTEDLCMKIRRQGFGGQLKPISDLMENCEFLFESIRSLKIILGDTYMVGISDDWLKAELESKKTVLEVLKSIEDKNFILLADVLEYDLNNILQVWLENLQGLEKIILGKALNGENSGSNARSNSRDGQQNCFDGAEATDKCANEVGPHSLGRKLFSH